MSKRDWLLAIPAASVTIDWSVDGGIALEDRVMSHYTLVSPDYGSVLAWADSDGWGLFNAPDPFGNWEPTAVREIEAMLRFTYVQVVSDTFGES